MVVVPAFRVDVRVVVAGPEARGPVALGCFVGCLRTREPVVVSGYAGDGVRGALGDRVRYGGLGGAR
ncbi:hypothetical protein ACH475_10340 [Streptomyces globisporus]|uniref:hypothetical protein n=1 Tax=Streptomyces globisporus TaxID=1908 RepID=UPI00296E9280|nr:hypothetical protein OG838_09230 [Streptomyces globisporus]WSV89436.1 hypothetical protein OG449_08805 [Streptomyces globisporus]